MLDNWYSTVAVHEAIHKLQKGITYNGNSIRGFVEGATELRTLDAVMKNRSHICNERKYNFNLTGYSDLVAIAKQLEVLFGKEALDQFAFQSDCTILDNLENIIGKDKYKLLRTDMNKSARGRKTFMDLMTHQNIIASSYFAKKFQIIQKQEEAEEFLLQMKEMNKARIKDNDRDDFFFRDLYSRFSLELKNSFPNLSSELTEYVEPEFYPIIYPDEAIERMDSLALGCFCPSSLEEFKNIDFSRYKRYRAFQGTDIFEVITKDGKPIYLNKLTKEDRANQIFIGSFANLDFVKNDEENKICVSLEDSYGEIKIEGLELTEIPLNVDKREIYETLANYLRPSGFWEKLKNKLLGVKELPPYIEDKPQFKEPNEQKQSNSWELPPSVLKEVIYKPGNETIIDKGNIHEEEIPNLEK